MEMKATRVAYGEALKRLGEENDKIVVFDADVGNATYTQTFQKAFPERFYQMGIAEANMVCAAAGIADMDFIPFVSAFAVFGIGRAYDQVRNTVAYGNCNVKLAMTHGGLTGGPDGGSHQAIEDIALTRVLPNVRVLCRRCTSPPRPIPRCARRRNMKDLSTSACRVWRRRCTANVRFGLAARM